MSDHDNPENFEVVEMRNGFFGHKPGWYVRRICPCHCELVVSVRFETQAEAERCLRVLNADYHRQALRAA